MVSFKGTQENLQMYKESGKEKEMRVAPIQYSCVDQKRVFVAVHVTSVFFVQYTSTIYDKK